MEPKKRGCLTKAFIVFSVVGWLLVLWMAGILPSGEPETQNLGLDEFPDLEEIWSEGNGETKVVLVPLRGPIFLGEESGFLSTSAGAADMALQAIRRATHDPEVKAIILALDSGGGGITASDILYQALLDFKAKDSSRRIVALFEDMAASGAYYVAMAADYVIAHPTTVTGSIGVLIQSLNIQELAEKIGVRDVTVKSGVNKDILNPLTDLTPDQRMMIQELVNEMHSRFVDKVARGRGLPEDVVRELADGRIYSAAQALNYKLVDEIGYQGRAVEKLSQLLKVPGVKVIRYEEALSLRSLFRAGRSWNPVSSLLQEVSTPRLLYMWRL